MTMGKNVGLTYGEFTFPAEQGFTGSAGVHQVKGYRRGGPVKKMAEGGKFGKPGDKYPKLKSGPAGKRNKMPTNVKMKGGEVHAQMGGSVGLGRMGGNLGQDREISVDDVRISVPKKHGGKMSVHDKLYHEGGKMGYAYGGQVKPSNTSAEFKQTRGKQDTMDTGNQPARRGRNQAEIEAGGTKRLKPGLKKGGYMKGAIKGAIKGVAHSGGGALADAALVRVRQVLKPSKKMKSPDKAKGRGMSKAGMPKNVKAHGGHVYATGGLVKKAGAAL
jgi:hypothetical protein